MAKIKMWDEFKNFAFKGNMIDLAVGVVIGTAFGTVINSMVTNVFMPLLSYVLPSKESYQDWQLGTVKIGVFIGDVLTFLIIALAIFIAVVKVMGLLRRFTAAPPAPAAAPTTKECPLCLSTIPIKARKCGHCTADLPATA